MSSRTVITLLTWNRVEKTKRTVDLFRKFNPGWDRKDWIVVDNGSTDGTLGYLSKHDYRTFPNKTNEGIFIATRKAWLQAVDEGYDFIINLQNDFPCLAKIPVNDIEKYLDENEDVGFVRLNQKKKKPGRDINQVTKKRFKFKPYEKCGNTEFSKHNHHFNFNPTMFRTSMVDGIVNPVVKARERQLMENHEKMGLKAAKIKYPCPLFKTEIRERMDGWIH